MKKWVLGILGIAAAVYGIFILQVGSGSSFWIVWEGLAAFFCLWSIVEKKGFFVVHKKLRRIFYVLFSTGVLSLFLLCGMIFTDFSSKGEPDLDYLIVLGAQVRKNGPSTILRYRLDAAADYLKENPNTVCIVSGGQGANEPCSEAEAMAEYLTERGIDQGRILLEDRSVNTVENIRYSKELLEQSYDSVGIVTNNFHVFRAVRIARAQGLKGVSGIAAYTYWFYLPNNMLRECAGIMKDWLMRNI